jgi:hypothetical protein
MKKRIIMILLIGILFITPGCLINAGEGTENKATDSDTSAVNTETTNEAIDSDISGLQIITVSSLGGISLGDSPERVVAVLGSNYTESTEPDVAGFIGEDMAVWSYESGIVVYIGQSSGKVLKIKSTSPDLQTDLGIRGGDNAETVFEAYRPLYKEAVSRHWDEVLEGWFHMEDGAVMIFDFDKSDSVLVNRDVTRDSLVEEIILAYWAHFD